MAKKQNDFSKPIRNRGEDIGTSRSDGPYSYAPNNRADGTGQERAIRRDEIRNRYDEMYRNEQRRDERAFYRTMQIDNEFYAGLDPRRRQEVADAGMLREDHKAMANLSGQAIHCEYPQAPYYKTPYLDDTVLGDKSFFEE